MPRVDPSNRVRCHAARNTASAALTLIVLALVAACSSSTTLTVGSPPAAPTAAPALPTVAPTPKPTAPAPTQPKAPTLVEDCKTGSDPACDILYLLTDAGSHEEAIAIDCGGRRRDNPQFCTDAIDPTDDLWASPKSDGIAVLVDGCNDGDWTACDFLYYLTPPGSRTEELGRTCGHRVTTAIPNCRGMLGR